MAIRYERTYYTWRPMFGDQDDPAVLAMGQRIMRRLGEILERWEGTPYRVGQSVAGVGVDCDHLVCAVLDELYEQELPPLPRLAPNTAIHSKTSALRAMHHILPRYPARRRVRDSVLEPGDVLITGPQGGGPGHAMLVGHRPNELWHCTRPMVCRTGFGLVATHQRVFGIYRLGDRARWSI